MNETLTGKVLPVIGAWLLLAAAVPFALRLIVQDVRGMEAWQQIAGRQQPVMRVVSPTEQRHYSGALQATMHAQGIVNGGQMKAMVEQYKNTKVKLQVGEIILGPNNDWGEYLIAFEKTYGLRWERDAQGQLVKIEFRLLPSEAGE